MTKPTGPQVMNAWNDLAAQHGLRKCLVMNTARMTQLRARSREPFWIENWHKALALVPLNPWYLGKNDRGWVANIEWFLRPNTVPRLIEIAETPRPKESRHEQRASDFEY